jgi:hypothetical protein
MLASVAREVAVMAVDHGQAGAHVAREVEGGDAGTEREGREGVAKIVDPPQRLDPGRELCRLPLAVAEVVQVEEPPRSAGKEQADLAAEKVAICAKDLAKTLGSARFAGNGLVEPQNAALLESRSERR